MPEHFLPGDIERTSMNTIKAELENMGISIPADNETVIRRVIHATADFDYAVNLRFTPDACHHGAEALKNRKTIITDTNMALAGISRPGLKKLGTEAVCFMAESFVAEKAKQDGTTRAVVAMKYAAENYPDAILAVGNAPTALFEISELIENGFRPSLVIAVPVGFVNVVEGKEIILETCTRYDIPAIAAMGRKGGSSVAAAICNALLYTAADMLDPAKRGWR